VGKHRDSFIQLPPRCPLILEEISVRSPLYTQAALIPFSMVVTGFEVFGAVSGAIGTLDLVRQLVVSIRTVAKNWKDSGPNVLEIHDGFDTFISPPRDLECKNLVD
jgi:hypothetical protein